MDWSARAAEPSQAAPACRCRPAGAQAVGFEEVRRAHVPGSLDVIPGLTRDPCADDQAPYGLRVKPAMTSALGFSPPAGWTGPRPARSACCAKPGGWARAVAARARYATGRPGSTAPARHRRRA